MPMDEFINARRAQMEGKIRDFTGFLGIEILYVLIQLFV
jgi:hypothetical protein